MGGNTNYNANSLPFLDLTIITFPYGTIATDLYRKPTAENSLLRADSAYPRPLIRGIPVGQYLCIHRNCTSDTDFKIQAKAPKDKFLKRGYSHKALKMAYKRALESPCEFLLFQGEH